MSEVKCEICGKTAESTDKACELGWTPYFYIGEVEHDAACLECTSKYLQAGGSGEMELKPDLSLDTIRQLLQNTDVITP
jgi:hypothetical protein